MTVGRDDERIVFNFSMLTRWTTSCKRLFDCDRSLINETHAYAHTRVGGALSRQCCITIRQDFRPAVASDKSAILELLSGIRGQVFLQEENRPHVKKMA